MRDLAFVEALDEPHTPLVRVVFQGPVDHSIRAFLIDLAPRGRRDAVAIGCRPPAPARSPPAAMPTTMAAVIGTQAART